MNQTARKSTRSTDLSEIVGAHDRLGRIIRGSRISRSTEICPGERRSPWTEIKPGERLSPVTEMAAAKRQWRRAVMV